MAKKRVTATKNCGKDRITILTGKLHIKVGDNWNLDSESFCVGAVLECDIGEIPSDGGLALLVVNGNPIHVGRYFYPTKEKQSPEFHFLTPGISEAGEFFRITKKINVHKACFDTLQADLSFRIFSISSVITKTPIPEKPNPNGKSIGSWMHPFVVGFLDECNRELMAEKRENPTTKRRSL